MGSETDAGLRWHPLLRGFFCQRLTLTWREAAASIPGCTMTRTRPGKTYTVGDVARIAKVTVRTLHHYDEIGLLTPSGRSGAGYRLYTVADIKRLHQVRLYRELGMPLEAIREILDAPGFAATAALHEHRRQLRQRLRDTAALVATIDHMLAEQGEEAMSSEELFEGFQPEEHRAEAEARWGHTPAWKESRRRTSSYGPQQWQAIKAEADGIVAAFAERSAAGDDPASTAVMAIAEAHREHIDRWFYPCSPAMHVGLAQMYVADERFAAHYDKHGEGLCAYVAAAIKANAARA